MTREVVVDRFGARLKMDEVWLIFVFIGLYIAPQMAPNGRWLTGVAAAAAVLGVIVWFAWVGQQTSSIGAGVAAFLVMLGGATAALGIAVRAVVLWRGWEDGRMILAVLGGVGLWVAALFALFHLT